MKYTLSLLLTFLMTLAFARAQEVSYEGVLMRHDPDPWLKWCQDADSGRLHRCDETTLLARVTRLNRYGRWWVQCTIDSAKIDLEAKSNPALLGWVRRGEGMCFHADGRDLHRWLDGDALRDLEVVVEQTPPGTIWWLMTENDPAALHSLIRAVRELLVERLPELDDDQ